MANAGVTATADVTGKTPQKPKPRLKPNLAESIQINSIEGGYKANEALRKYQQEAAQRQLANAMSTIDRSSMQAYKAIADNYAARGMQRSGGYVTADDLAKAASNEQKAAAQGAYTDLVDQQAMTAVQEKQQAQMSIFDILLQGLGAKIAAQIAGLEGK